MTSLLLLLTIAASVLATANGRLAASSVRGTRVARSCPRDLDWSARTDLDFFKLSSQSWQDGYLAYVFQNIGVTNKYYVEFGFNSNSFEQGSGANTYLLHRAFGWTGLLLDGDHSNATINLHREFLSPDNIVSVFEKYSVPVEPDYVSIDVDSADVLILEKLLASKFSPRVLTVEYNANFPLDATISVTPSMQWNMQDRRYGASLGAVHAVARRHGYSIVNVVPSLDAVLVRDDVLCSGRVPPHETWRPLTNVVSHGPCPGPECVQSFMDSEVYIATHDLGRAQKAAQAYLSQHPTILQRM